LESAKHSLIAKGLETNTDYYEGSFVVSVYMRKMGNSEFLTTVLPREAEEGQTDQRFEPNSPQYFYINTEQSDNFCTYPACG
jgi:hypothetical protein